MGIVEEEGGTWWPLILDYVTM